MRPTPVRFPSGPIPGISRHQFSPRVGISHPITERSVVYFNYGHFYQNPIYRNIYIQGTLEDSVPLIGNPELESEKTVSYEFGYKHQFTEIYALEVIMWGKDTSNLVGTERVPAFFGGVANPYDYTVFLNYDYALSKGIDLSLIKRYSDFWSTRVNYSYMTTQSNRDDPWAGYRGGDELETSPKRQRLLGWDQPHRVSSSISISIPQGVGPEVFGIRPFERFNASLIYTASAGRPYTPTTKEKMLEPNSGRRPWTFSWSAKIYRDFESFGLRYSIFADIRNLFNRSNVRSVYSRILVLLQAAVDRHRDPRLLLRSQLRRQQRSINHRGSFQGALHEPFSARTDLCFVCNHAGLSHPLLRTGWGGGGPGAA